MFPMTDDTPKGDMPDMGGGTLKKALEMSGVKGEKLDKLVEALDSWKSGNDALLRECADDYATEEKDEPTSEEPKTEEPKDEKPKGDSPFGGGKAPPFGGKSLAEKEDSAIKRATMKFGG